MFYTVRQGDHLPSIAADHGWADWRVIWAQARNKPLRDLRRNPNVLNPGDQIYIPNAQVGVMEAGTGAAHHYKVRRPPLQVRFVLLDCDFQPLAHRHCVLLVDGARHELTSDGTGLVKHPIPATAHDARLQYTEDDDAPLRDLPVLIGHLDPVTTLAGQSARLRNLGYLFEDVRAEDDAAFRSAVEEFQLDHMGERAVDGACGSRTQTKLMQVHGC